MKYAVAFEPLVELSHPVFAQWDSEEDIGYGWYYFDELIPLVSVFDDEEDAIDYARDVVCEVDFDELYVISVDDNGETECLCSVIPHHV